MGPAEDEKKPIKALDAGDIALLKSYGQGPYTKSIKTAETDIEKAVVRVNNLCGAPAPPPWLAANEVTPLAHVAEERTAACAWPPF